MADEPVKTKKPEPTQDPGSDSIMGKVRDSVQPFIDKGKEDLQGAKDYKKTQVWGSVFRHKLDDTPRTRALAVLTNVFLHLHPAKVNRDAVRFRFTW